MHIYLLTPPDWGCPHGVIMNFSLASTPRCRGWCYSFPWIASLYLCSLPHNVVLSQETSSTYFWVYGMIQPGIDRLPDYSTNYSVSSSGQDCMFHLYLKDSENIVHLIFFEWFCFVHRLFVSIIKFWSLAQFSFSCS